MRSGKSKVSAREPPFLPSPGEDLHPRRKGSTPLSQRMDPEAAGSVALVCFLIPVSSGRFVARRQ
jgi:hypothetical protein